MITGLRAYSLIHGGAGAIPTHANFIDTWEKQYCRDSLRAYQLEAWADSHFLQGAQCFGFLWACSTLRLLL